MGKLYAICTRTDSGWDNGKELIDAGIKLGDKFEVENISMGQSNTTIYLQGYKHGFNSVHFDFEEDGEPIDIYNDPRFNPYYYI